MLALDCSKYTSPRSPAAMQRVKNEGVGAVIIQAHPPGYGPDATLELMRSARDVGMPFDAYIYEYVGYSEWVQGALQTLNRAASEDLVPLRIWFDIEDVEAQAKAMSVPQRVAAYERDLRLIDQWSVQMGLPRPGVYSGKWYWDQYLPGITAWKDRDLWDSDYDGVPDVDVGFRPYGGWLERAIKQHVGTSVYAGMSGIDQNALSYKEALRILGAVGEETEELAYPVPEEYTQHGWNTWRDVAINLQGIADELGKKLNEPEIQVADLKDRMAQINALSDIA